MPASLHLARNHFAGATVPRSRSPLKLFLLVFALSAPFWLLGGLTGWQLSEGLPVSSLAGFCPLAAALILTHGEEGAEGMKHLLQRALDYRRIRAKVWYAPIVLLMPAILALSYAVMRLMRVPLPPLQISVITTAAMLLVCLIEAAGEELGWMGYAIDPVQARRGALQASLLLGLVGVVWHIVLFAQAHRSLAWIGWQSLFIVASRVLTVWLYNSAGKSVFATILFHAVSNLSSFLFPQYGSHYDPRLTGILTGLAALLVTVVWGPQTLAGDRRGGLGLAE